MFTLPKSIYSALALTMLVAFSSPASAAWLLQGLGQPSGQTYYACKCKDGTIAINWTTHAFTQAQCELSCGPRGIELEPAGAIVSRRTFPVILEPSPPAMSADATRR